MSTPGHWDGLYHRQTGHLLINYYDIDPHMGRKFVSTNAYIYIHHSAIMTCLLCRCVMTIVSSFTNAISLINASATEHAHIKWVDHILMVSNQSVISNVSSKFDQNVSSFQTIVRRKSVTCLAGRTIYVLAFPSMQNTRNISTSI